MASLKSKGFYHLTGIFVFPVYTPPGVFSRLIVRLSQPQFELTYLAHWSSGIYVRHKTNKITFVIQ